MSMPVICPSKTPRCQAITDIIESVALEQTALSHILNAEGEKLQKVVAMKDVCTEELLRINESVQQTIKAVAQLEMVLLSKLQLFDDCLCECDKCDKCEKHDEKPEHFAHY